MKSLNKPIGNYGEDIASNFLTSNGYKIIKRNYFKKFGEIDIICLKKDILVFVEVKSRYQKNFGSGIEYITKKKINRIKKLTEYFLLEKQITNYFVRFDIVEIYFNYNDLKHKIIHTKDAFR